MTDRSVKDNIPDESKANFFSFFLLFSCNFQGTSSSYRHQSWGLMTVAEYNKAVDLYADKLYRFVLKNLKDEHMSNDIIQDTFEKLWVKLEDVSGLKVKTYLFTSAYHTMIDYIRKQKRYSSADPANDLESTHSVHYSDLGEILEKAVEQLPEDQKAVVMLRDYEGYSYREIAEITELTETQVKVYIYRARVFLKNYIGSMEKVI
jgi:RNA polymerase sigma-70 factor (ECF subfamily)